MIYAREPMANVLHEIQPLLIQHWQEIAHFKDIPLDPDWHMYAAADDADKLRIYTARDSVFELAGYAIFILGNMHYKSTKTAHQDIVFLRPEHRGFAGFRLLRFADQELSNEGIEVVYHHVKAAHNFGPLLERMGYVAVDTIYARRF